MKTRYNTSVQFTSLGAYEALKRLSDMSDLSIGKMIDELVQEREQKMAATRPQSAPLVQLRTA
jgi:hypothetical protein